MTEEVADPPRAQPDRRIRAAFYPPAARAAAGLLKAIGGANLLGVLALVLLSEGPVNPLRLMRLVAALSILPGLGALAVRWLHRGFLRIDGATLVLEQRRRRVEIPTAAIASIDPWLLPLPGSGLSLRLRAGERWPEGIETADPTALVDELDAAGAASKVRGAARDPAMTYARARSRIARRSWRHLMLRFPVFALVPTIPLFRVHQIIAYGGAFGEYLLYGPGPYLAGFAIYWATLTIYLVLYAAALRVPVELLCAASAWMFPRRALAARRILERAAGVLYYAGVPIAVILRFLP